MKTSIKTATVLALALLASSCTWVQLTEEGANVAVLTAAEVRNCTQLADTTVSVRDRVLLNRKADKVAEELRTLARNAAANRGGDAIVPASPVRDGRRNYDIYQCRR